MATTGYGIGEYGIATYEVAPGSVPAPRPPTLTWTVRINGVLTPTRTFRTSHSVNKPVATGSITIKAPKPIHAEIGATVTIHAGYDGASLPIFSGRIPDYRGAFSSSGGEVTIELEGKGRRLFYGHDTWLGVQGPLRMFSWWRSLANYVGIANYWADATEDVDGFDLMLGDNPQINDGIALVDRRSSPGAEMARLARLFGYRHFETQTHIRLQRVSGLPTKPVEELVKFEQGVNVREIRRDEHIDGIANYWDVYGAEYTAADGSEVAIRSLPAVITADPLYGPSGVAREEIRDSALTTWDLADASRNAHEVDYSEPSSIWSLETRGDPERTPGEQIALLSQDVGPQVVVTGSVVSFPVAAWLMSVDHDGGEGGWTTRMTGWTGAGTALPAGSDCTTITLLGSDGRHLGDETLSHYRRPQPDGTIVKLPFTVPDDYSTLTLLYEAHGTNSYMTDTETNVSRFEIWQGGERATDQGDLPFLPEYLEQKFDYSTNGNPRAWSPGVNALSGSLAAGAAELWIISGTDTGFDDFEVKNVRLRLCGIGTPLIVGNYESG
jgi:hypothetical protein